MSWQANPFYRVKPMSQTTHWAGSTFVYMIQ
jgi:hypothetical protein